MARGLSAEEQFFRRVESLALSALPTRELTAAADKHHDGVMVALVPDNPESLVVGGDEALTADDLHVTLCYLGKVQDLSSFDKTEILTTTRRVVDEIGHAFSTNADGVIIMGKNDEGIPATALLVQSDDIVELYDALSDALNYHSSFPSFIPHMTMGYGVPAEVAEERIGSDVVFNNVLVKFGDDRHEIPLPTGITAAPAAPNVIDRVVDSLGRLWDEALHPRDSEGRFIKKNGAVSGKLAVPSKDRKNVTMVDANRASVVGFHTFGDEIWVLAEITNPDGSTQQGFARASQVKSVAPVKARLDALYPVDDRDHSLGVNSGLERQRQLDLLLAHINSEYGADSDGEDALAFLETLGLNDDDLDYIYDNESEFLDGIRRVDRSLTDEERAEADDIISDARAVKELRDRVHGLDEEVHVQPEQKLLTPEAPDADVVAALNRGEDPFTIEATNLLAAMQSSDRFKRVVPVSKTGISPIEWYTDSSDKTGHSVGLAGTGSSTTDRAYFVKTSMLGAEFDNSDISREVLASMIYEQFSDDVRALQIPKAVFGDNPEWDGVVSQGKGETVVRQPGHVVMQHASYFAPADWETTDAFTEEVVFRNDLKNVIPEMQDDQIAAFKEDMGDLYGNSIAQMVLWDYVIQNTDRNPSNALLVSPPGGGEGRALPIDHGFAFEPEPDAGETADSAFDWFMNYPTTLGWLSYVRGGLSLNENVSEDTLRQVFNDFIATYQNIDASDIINRFRGIPGVTEEQISDVETWMEGVVDRLNYIVQNSETVFNGIVGRS